MSQKGFANIILVIVIVVLLVVVGYFVFVKRSEPVVRHSIATNQNKNYLTIKEWGVEFEKPDGMNDLQYTIHNPEEKAAYTSLAIFTTQQLVDLDKLTGGKCTGYSIGVMARYTAQELNDLRNDKYGPGVPDNVKVGNYYYSFSMPQEACSFNERFKELEVKQTSALRATVLKSLRAASYINEQSAISPKDETAGWQIYEGRKFQLLIPPQWHEDPNRPGILTPTANSPYYLSFDVVDPSGDAQIMVLFRNGKLLEAERAIIKSMCGETESCGEIVESKSIPVSGGVGIEYIVRYKGLNEIHRTILKDNTLYRFWTSENENPKLDPPPVELFRKIMDTFRGS